MELVRYPQVRTLSTPKSHSVASVVSASVFTCAATAAVAFLFLSEQQKSERFEAERAHMTEQLRMESERVHALSLEVNSLTGKINSTPAPGQAPAAAPKMVILPRKSVPYSPPPPVQQASATPPTAAGQPAVTKSAAPQPAVQDRNYSADIQQLNESIATTHDQVLALERRGARHYVEFKLGRTTAFQEIGPLWVQVRKVNAKHGYYDISFIVDGHMLQKSHVNLYEPIWINTVNRPLQFQLVANSITKNEIGGYLSEPKTN